ncbi:MAG: hypothetical protein AB8V01_04805, partial [Candidatus Midichloria sp.]
LYVTLREYQETRYFKEWLSFDYLYNRGLKLVTGIKRGNQLICMFEKILLRKRSIMKQCLIS